MDAATLYTIITLASGEERLMHEKYPSVAACEKVRRMMEGTNFTREYRARYSCERHIRLAPQNRTTE